MVNLVHIVWGRSSYVTRLGLNCCMSTWTTTRRHAKNTHLSEMRYVGHVLRIELVDPKMHRAKEKRDGKRTIRGLHSLRGKGKVIREKGGGGPIYYYWPSLVRGKG
uniref:Uncharacterized protein n=1 Tax=Picea glauca TaxID=3330 RepID=A0A101LUI5_PICGL|nr:hypothetical protein ABT39_MTgene2391 [Picea glauca]QHR88981.1 hypothetical protein Q903MT_gene3000 [Picea sitchensis]